MAVKQAYVVRLRQIKEGKGDKISIVIRENISRFKIRLSEMFLSSLSIQLSTAPIILYFFRIIDHCAEIVQSHE